MKLLSRSIFLVASFLQVQAFAMTPVCQGWHSEYSAEVGDWNSLTDNLEKLNETPKIWVKQSPFGVKVSTAQKGASRISGLSDEAEFQSNIVGNTLVAKLIFRDHFGQASETSLSTWSWTIDGGLRFDTEEVPPEMTSSGFKVATVKLAPTQKEALYLASYPGEWPGHFEFRFKCWWDQE